MGFILSRGVGDLDNPHRQKGAPTKKLYTPRGVQIQKHKGGVFHKRGVGSCLRNKHEGVDVFIFLRFIDMSLLLLH